MMIMMIIIIIIIIMIMIIIIIIIIMMMMMIMIMIIIIIIIIIVVVVVEVVIIIDFKGARSSNNNRFQRRYSRFFAISSQRRELSQTYAQVVRAQPCANHVQHIERLSRASVMLRASWYEGTAQLLSLTELKSHLIELYFIG